MTEAPASPPRYCVVLQHVPHETLGRLAICLDQAGVAQRVVPLYMKLMHEMYWEWDQVAGLVVLGGPMNVDEISQYPFLERELTWIRAAVVRDLPVLGICLGAQLLAKSLDARVFPNPVKEIGWYDLELTLPANNSLFGGLTGRHKVFQWHGDTYELPAGAVQLARSEQCEQQAFRYGTRAYGLQFHVEVTAEMVEDWLNEPANQRELRRLNYIDPVQIRRQMQTAISDMEFFGRHILSRFSEMCRQKSLER